MKHKLAKILLLVLLMPIFILGCDDSSESDGKNKDKDQEKGVFDGTYYREIKYINIDSTLKSTFNIDGTSYTLTHENIITSSQESLQETIVTGSLEILDDYLDGKKVNEKPTSILLTPMSQAQVDKLNQDVAYGISDWALRVTRDVTNTDYLGQAVTWIFYTIYKVENNNLYFGKYTSDYDQSSDEKRSIEYNSESYFTLISN